MGRHAGFRRRWVSILSWSKSFRWLSTWKILESTSHREGVARSSTTEYQPWCSRYNHFNLWKPLYLGSNRHNPLDRSNAGRCQTFGVDTRQASPSHDTIYLQSRCFLHTLQFRHCRCRILEDKIWDTCRCDQSSRPTGESDISPREYWQDYLVVTRRCSGFLYHVHFRAFVFWYFGSFSDFWQPFVWRALNLSLLLPTAYKKALFRSPKHIFSESRTLLSVLMARHCEFSPLIGNCIEQLQDRTEVAFFANVNSLFGTCAEGFLRDGLPVDPPSRRVGPWYSTTRQWRLSAQLVTCWRYIEPLVSRNPHLLSVNSKEGRSSLPPYLRLWFVQSLPCMWEWL